LSVIYLKKLCPNARILAFEPDPTNYSLLKKNIQSFGFPDVELMEAAVWTKNTTLQFSSGGNMGSSISTDSAKNTLQVKAVRLNDYLNEPVDFLKIDIEGAEYEVVRDIADSLPNVKRMFLEYHGRFDQHQELLEMLEIVRRSGFSFYIREAAPVYPVPFRVEKNNSLDYDVQLNIFCLRP
jgi:FkbM family methyltransferase